MSYDREMLTQLKMPTRQKVEQLLLESLLNHGGVLREFGSGTEIEDEIAAACGLTNEQRTSFLETVYRKENRVKKSVLWHRLLFRAADTLAKANMVSRPSQTLRLTNKREWMLTELGYNEALIVCRIPLTQKDFLPIKSFEVQRIVKKLTDSPMPENYDPIHTRKRFVKKTFESALRGRGFRQAVIEAYNFRCAICGLKINSPDLLFWEVEAAHIVPNYFLGRDDIWNGIALCHFHHWAFDVGWFTLSRDYHIEVSTRIHTLPADFGKMGTYDVLRSLANETAIRLPMRNEIFPHQKAILWHRHNIFLGSRSRSTSRSL